MQRLYVGNELRLGLDCRVNIERDGAGIAAARGGAQGGEADVVADGIRDVLCGGDPDAVPDRSEWGSADLSAVVVDSVARDVPAAGGAAAGLLVVLRDVPLKSGSGCPDPCRPSNEERR